MTEHELHQYIVLWKFSAYMVRYDFIDCEHNVELTLRPLMYNRTALVFIPKMFNIVMMSEIGELITKDKLLEQGSQEYPSSKFHEKPRN